MWAYNIDTDNSNNMYVLTNNNHGNDKTKPINHRQA